ncbi:MAG: Ig-like domain-containing protein [Lachnospiraceae bacterium]|nr:Ig-like domain-containing protein [Lachnospiraceae bacterium]MDD7668501.1 Ig-like domain-containing protein [Lachnospiraceae bacterium]MDY2620928.1 Ig-like domain-containing protein [Agathobacter sp.]
MEKKKITWTKRILTLMVAVAVLLTSSLVTVPVYAASKPMVVSKYMLAKGEKFTLNVYNEPDNAKISYKSKKSAVASVNKKGVVTAKKPGKTDIVVTVKVGKKTYQAKTKVTVKKSLTAAEYVATTYAELALMYTSACDLAIANGWDQDADVVDTLNAVGDIVTVAGDMTKHPKNYSEEDFMDELDAIETAANGVLELLPIISEPAQ